MCSALKKTGKNNKLKNVYFIYIQDLKYKFSKSFNKVTASLFEGFKQKEIFFNETSIINTFLSKSIRKTYKINHIKGNYVSV